MPGVSIISLSQTHVNLQLSQKFNYRRTCWIMCDSCTQYSRGHTYSDWDQISGCPVLGLGVGVTIKL